jgi:uncharacterized membrane protein
VVVWTLTIAVVALEIPYPLVHGHPRNVLTIATVLVFALASLAHSATYGGARRVVALLVVVGGGGFAAEAIGVHTGYPFGRYHYTGGLGASVAGVPLVIPLAWVMMAHPAAIVARRLVGGPAAVIAATVAFATWDVFLDPQMVAARHWTWSDPSPHLPGIANVPLSNFGGWLLVALVLLSILRLAARLEPGHDDRPAVTLWMWTWLSSTLANVAFFDRPAVAGWGFLAMGVVGVPLLVRSARR